MRCVRGSAVVPRDYGRAATSSKFLGRFPHDGGLQPITSLNFHRCLHPGTRPSPTPLHSRSTGPLRIPLEASATFLQRVDCPSDHKPEPSVTEQHTHIHPPVPWLRWERSFSMLSTDSRILFSTQLEMIPWTYPRLYVS
jgi:hypothetical protein